MGEKRLARVQHDRMFLGVASGVADYLNLDPVIVRVLFVLLTLTTGGTGLLLYIILAFVMPEEQGYMANANVFDDEEIVIKDTSG